MTSYFSFHQGRWYHRPVVLPADSVSLRMVIGLLDSNREELWRPSQNHRGKRDDRRKGSRPAREPQRRTKRELIKPVVRFRLFFFLFCVWFLYYDKVKI